MVVTQDITTVAKMHILWNFLCHSVDCPLMRGRISLEQTASLFFNAPWLFDDVTTIYFHL